MPVKLRSAEVILKIEPSQMVSLSLFHVYEILLGLPLAVISMTDDSFSFTSNTDLSRILNTGLSEIKTEIYI